MTDPIDAVRAALSSLAAEGRPVDLGRQALARLRRRRRRVNIAAGLGVVLLVAAALAWPQGLGRDRASPKQSAPAHPLTDVWPPFSGLGRVPAAAGPASDRLVVAAYSTGPTRQTYVLDPRAGQYRPVAADRVLAVSPDLLFAVVLREHPVATADGGPLAVGELGIVDTSAGRVLGRLAVDAWTDPRAGFVVSQAVWSPDGARLVASVRHAVAGRGWQAVRLLFVDVVTGAVQPTEIKPSNGLEPIDLLGWTTDSQAVVLTADQVFTDQVPSGHLVFDRAGTPVAAIHWGMQANAVLVVGHDELGLVSADGSQAAVLNVRTGATRKRYAGASVTALGNPFLWREGEALARPQKCGASGCVNGTQIVGIAVDTGHSRVLHSLDEAQQDILVAPANGLAHFNTAPAW